MRFENEFYKIKLWNLYKNGFEIYYVITKQNPKLLYEHFFVRYFNFTTR